jgi:hypothetical protein
MASTRCRAVPRNGMMLGRQIATVPTNGMMVGSQIATVTRSYRYRPERGHSAPSVPRPRSCETANGGTNTAMMQLDGERLFQMRVSTSASKAVGSSPAGFYARVPHIHPLPNRRPPSRPPPKSPVLLLLLMHSANLQSEVKQGGAAPIRLVQMHISRLNVAAENCTHWGCTRPPPTIPAPARSKMPCSIMADRRMW